MSDLLGLELLRRVHARVLATRRVAHPYLICAMTMRLLSVYKPCGLILPVPIAHLL